MIEVIKNSYNEYFLSDKITYTSPQEMADLLNISVSQYIIILCKCGAKRYTYTNSTFYLFNEKENAEMALTMIKMIEN